MPPHPSYNFEKVIPPANALPCVKLTVIPSHRLTIGTIRVSRLIPELERIQKSTWTYPSPRLTWMMISMRAGTTSTKNSPTLISQPQNGLQRLQIPLVGQHSDRGRHHSDRAPPRPNPSYRHQLSMRIMSGHHRRFHQSGESSVLGESLSGGYSQQY